MGSTPCTLTLRGVATGAAGAPSSSVRRGRRCPCSAGVARSTRTGHYIVRGLIPAAYQVRVTPPDPRVRFESRWQPLTLTTSTIKDLAAGPRQGIYRARFVSGAAPVTRGATSALGGAVSAAGDQAWIYPGADGRVRQDTMRPGDYRYRPSTWRTSVPATDGPWWFGAPTGGFTINAGRVTDVGTIALHVHARR